MEKGGLVSWMSDNAAGKRVGYARVSTIEQKLDMQTDALEKAGCDWIFKDEGISGGPDAVRPGLFRAIKALQAGDVFVVFKLDRLGRSVMALSDLLMRFQKEGIHFHSITEGINTETSGGRMVFHFFSAIAEFERDLIHERTVHGLTAARARGKRLGRPYALENTTIVDAHQAIKLEGITIGEAARRLGVAHVTLTRAFKRLGLND